MFYKLTILILVLLLAGCSLDGISIGAPTLTPGLSVQTVPTSPPANNPAGSPTNPNTSPFAGQPLMAPLHPTTAPSSGGSFGGNNAPVTVIPPLNFGITATYRDDRLGFAFDYPANWFIVGEGATFQLWSVNPASYNLEPDNVVANARGDYIILDFIIDTQIANETLAAAVQRYRDTSGQTILSETPIDLNGLPAIELKTSTKTIIVTVINGRTFWVEGLGAPAMFYTVVGRLRAA